MFYIKIEQAFVLGVFGCGWDYLCDVFGFYICDNCPNTLLGWIVGPAARNMEQKSLDEIKIGLMYLLNKFLGDKYTIPFPDLVTR